MITGKSRAMLAGATCRMTAGRALIDAINPAREAAR
jgi:hypothetical protein